MISLLDVEKSFGGVHAVRGVTVDIPAGQIVGILGPNGAGKTTTIRMIAAAIPPSAGSVRVGGFDAVSQSDRVRRKIGYMPESAPLYREMRVGEMLRFRAGLYGLAGRARTQAVGRAAGQCQLETVLRRRVGQLSKGFRQRVGLAAAMLHDPELLILDEPTSGLDPAQIAETRRLIRDLAGRRTMLIVSHILPEVERSCDRIILFAKGLIRADGPPAQLSRSLGGSARCIIEARWDGAPADPRAVFAAVEGVRTCEVDRIDDAWWRARLTLDDPAVDPREAVARAARDAGALIRELRTEASTLEDLYLRLIAESVGAAGDASQARAEAKP